MQAKSTNPKYIKSNLSYLVPTRRNPFNRRFNRSTTLRLPYRIRSYSHLIFRCRLGGTTGTIPGPGPVAESGSPHRLGPLPDTALPLGAPDSPAISAPPPHRGPAPATGTRPGPSAHRPLSGVFWCSGRRETCPWLEAHVFGGASAIGMDFPTDAVQGGHLGINLNDPFVFQGREDRWQQPPFVPPMPAPIDGWPRAELLRQRPPLAAVLVDLQQGV